MVRPREEQGPREDNEDREPSPEPPILASHITYFIVPLPEPIGFPDGYRVVCAERTGGERYRAAEAAGEPLPPPVHTAATLRFHRGEIQSPTANVTARLLDLASVVFPGNAGKDVAAVTQPDRSLPMVPQTFVEIAVAVDPDESNDGGVSDAFDRGLGYIRGVQRAYYLLRRRPVRLATREAMPFMVPFGVRRLLDDEGEPLPFRIPMSLMFLHMNIDRETRDDELAPEELKGLTHGLWQQSQTGFVSDYLEFVRESEVALTADGSYRAAVLFAATSCEVLLDNLLAHLLWEDGERPEDAAALFSSSGSGLTARVKRHFHPRLGGQWSLDAPGPLRDWFSRVAGLRNRVVHGGYEPDLEEARAAVEAAATLASHLGDAVAARADKYSRTAFALPGEPGLRRRGVWTQRLERVWQDPDEVNWIATFARWRDAMRRSTADSPTCVSPSTDDAWLYAVIRPDGSLQWVAHDGQAGMAAPVPAEDVVGLSPHQAEELEKLREHVRDADGATATSVTFSGVSLGGSAIRAWVPEYRLVPMAGVMVHGQDLDEAT